MRGLIYKDFCLFFKSIEKKVILIAVAAIILLMAKAGVYSGLFASVMFSMAIGMQSIMSFSSDEKADWKRYQLAMPVNGYRAVGSKYVSLILILGISIAGSVIFSLTTCIIQKNFDLNLMGISVMTSIIIFLGWMGICLPLTYWFGFRSAQTIELIVVIPIFYLVKYFEDGPGISNLATSINAYFLMGLIAAIVIFLVSFMISVAGYSQKK